MRSATLCGMSLCLALSACGGDDPKDGEQTCSDVCGSQQAAEEAGNCPGLGLTLCLQLCDAALSGTCGAAFTRLNKCMLTGEFACGFVSAQSNADCTAESQEYRDCMRDNRVTCQGANDAGFCPSVTCDCPGGEQAISGTITNGSSCTCADVNSCQQFCF